MDLILTIQWFITSGLLTLSAPWLEYLAKILSLISILLTFILAVDSFIFGSFFTRRHKITTKNALILIIVYWIILLVLAISIGFLSSQRAVILLVANINLELLTNIFVLAVLFSDIFQGFRHYLILDIIIYRKLKQSKQNFGTISNHAEKRIRITLPATVLTNVFRCLPPMQFTIIVQVTPEYDSIIFNYFSVLFYYCTLILRLIKFFSWCKALKSDHLVIKLVKIVIIAHEKADQMQRCNDYNSFLMARLIFNAWRINERKPKYY